MVSDATPPIDPRAARYLDTINEARIPGYMREGVIHYLAHGIEPGSFLSAIFCNDLVGAAAAADIANQHALMGWASLLYHLPACCWGSNAVVSAWIKHQGFSGYDQRVKPS